MPGRYECNLSPEALSKAVEELNEPADNDVRLEMIDALKTRFQEEIDDMELIRSDDAFLLRFLRFRKFDQERAFKSLVNYHKHRRNWREVFNMVDDPNTIEDFLDIGSVVPITDRAKDGSFVSIARPGRNFRKEDGILHYFAATILTAEKLLENEEMQIYGLTVIQDMKEFGIGLAIEMTPVGMQYLNLMQDALPVRMKSFDIVNEAAPFDVIYAVVRPFIKEKLRKRLRLHGENFEALHATIDPEYLPEFLGGNKPDRPAAEWKAELLAESTMTTPL